MFTASPCHPLSQPAGQSVVADARRNLRVNPQGDSFETANTADYLRSCPVRAFQPLASTSQVHGRFRIRGNRAAPVENKLNYNSPEAQFGLYRSGSLLQPENVSAYFLPIDHLGQAAPLRNRGVWLQELLLELAECPSCAREDEMDEPSDLALSKAKELLEEVANYVSDRPEIYPMQQSSIAIDFRDADSKSGVLLLIEEDGSGALFHRTGNSKGRLRVDDAADLLKEGGIKELKRVGIR